MKSVWLGTLFLLAVGIPTLSARASTGFAKAVQARTDPEPPVWPDQYEVSWELNLPYIETVQSAGLEYHFTAWHDKTNKMQKFLRDGVELYIVNVKADKQFTIFPRLDEIACVETPISNGSVPMTGGDGDKQEAALQLVLPDLREDRWVYNGTHDMDGIDAHQYTWVLSSDYGYGEVTATYDFFVDAERGEPLMLRMLGRDLYSGSHYDKYKATFHSYTPGAIDAGEFEVPDLCHEESAAVLGRNWKGPLEAQLRQFLPNPHYQEAEYDTFVHHFGRRHDSKEEYHSRRQLYHQHKQLIVEWNAAQNSSHTLGMNRFGDWGHAEFLEVMLPRTRAGGLEAQDAFFKKHPGHVGHHQRSLPDHMLPTTVEWRGSGADSRVKDQASCGSCWAFGAVGALEAAYYRATGRARMFSEQQLVDCGWRFGNNGCMGGFQDFVMEWVFERGGLAAEEEFPYQGINNYCREDAASVVKFKEPKQVWVTGGEKDLQDAILTKGPMTVNVDASAVPFKFYKSGVYQNPDCKTGPAHDLDHAVMVSGYGSEAGTDYWLVRNSWSSYWGDGGYIKVARSPNDCGITSLPIYVEFGEVEEDAGQGSTEAVYLEVDTDDAGHVLSYDDAEVDLDGGGHEAA